MPELPEVETIAMELNQALRNRVVEKVEVLREKSFARDKKWLKGKKITGVGRKAKVLIFKFEKEKKVMLVHLKMTGQLIYVNKKGRVAGGHPTLDWVKELPNKHTRVVISFADGSKLFFNDLRVFGWMRIVGEEDWKKEEEKLPADVVDSSFTLDYFKKVLTKTGRTIKLVLLDQKKMGGVGNIYANEALFLAGIHPEKKTNKLSKERIKRLYGAVKKVIEKGIKYGGATASNDNYVNALGFKGGYQKHFLVYDRRGEKCRKCRSKIEKIKVSGRGTYYCKKCQTR